MTDQDTRPKLPIRLIVSDIDGTLLTKAKEITPRARAAIDEAKRRGIGFAVASARPPAGLRRIIEAMGIVVPVAAVNGGAIIRPDLTVIDTMLVPPEAVMKTVSILRREGLNPWLFTQDAWFLRDPDGPHVEREARTVGLTPKVVADFTQAQIESTIKLVGASHDHPMLAECERILQAELSGIAMASRSQAYYLDVVNAAANKGEAVVGIARAAGVPLDQVLTIGDGANDTPMFGVSGFSVAMGNGTDAVKNLASAVTDTNENEGFAKAIERHVLGQEGL